MMKTRGFQMKLILNVAAVAALTVFAGEASEARMRREGAVESAPKIQVRVSTRSSALNVRASVNEDGTPGPVVTTVPKGALLNVDTAALFQALSSASHERREKFFEHAATCKDISSAWTDLLTDSRTSKAKIRYVRVTYRSKGRDVPGYVAAKYIDPRGTSWSCQDLQRAVLNQISDQTATCKISCLWRNVHALTLIQGLSGPLADLLSGDRNGMDSAARALGDSVCDEAPVAPQVEPVVRPVRVRHVPQVTRAPVAAPVSTRPAPATTASAPQLGSEITMPTIPANLNKGPNTHSDKECFDRAVTSLRDHDPKGYEIYTRFNDDKSFGEWLQCGIDDLQIDQAVHEATHMLDLASPRNYVTISGDVKLDRNLPFFNRSEIFNDLTPSEQSNGFTTTYIINTGRQPMPILLTELNAYTNDLNNNINMVALKNETKSIYSSSSPYGPLLMTLRYTQDYLKLARRDHPRLWAKMKSSPTFASGMAQLWANAVDTLARACALPASDHVTLNASPQLMGRVFSDNEIDSVRELLGGSLDSRYFNAVQGCPVAPDDRQ